MRGWRGGGADSKGFYAGALGLAGARKSKHPAGRQGTMPSIGSVKRDADYQVRFVLVSDEFDTCFIQLQPQKSEN